MSLKCKNCWGLYMYVFKKNMITLIYNISCRLYYFIETFVHGTEPVIRKLWWIIDIRQVPPLLTWTVTTLHPSSYQTMSLKIIHSFWIMVSFSISTIIQHKLCWLGNIFMTCVIQMQWRNTSFKIYTIYFKVCKSKLF